MISVTDTAIVVAPEDPRQARLDRLLRLRERTAARLAPLEAALETVRRAALQDVARLQEEVESRTDRLREIAQQIDERDTTIRDLDREIAGLQARREDVVRARLLLETDDKIKALQTVETLRFAVSDARDHAAGVGHDQRRAAIPARHRLASLDKRIARLRMYLGTRS